MQTVMINRAVAAWGQERRDLLGVSEMFWILIVVVVFYKGINLAELINTYASNG